MKEHSPKDMSEREALASGCCVTSSETPQGANREAKGRHSQSDGAVKDPVCGMTVDPARAAASYELGGEMYYFCSAGCHNKFAEAPEQYLKPKTSSRPEGEGTYVCPMHPEVTAVKPGACSKCGMALERAAYDLSPAIEYTCPMHPEIRRSGPGTCPICGMALEPQDAAIETDDPELQDMSRRFWWSV